MAEPPTAPPSVPVQNSKALAALILGVLAFLVPVPFVLGIVAIVLGNQARREIEADPRQDGEGLAVAGVVLGWVDVALSALAVVAFLVFILFFGGLALFAMAAC